MNKPGLKLAILCATWLLCACATPGPAQTALPPATPQILFLTHTPALRPWRAQAAACAAALPEIGLRLEETAAGITLDGADAVIDLGEPSDAAGFNTLLGYENLRLVVHAQAPIRSLDQTELARLFNTGHISPGDAGFEVWFYPPGDELEQALSSVLPSPPSFAWLAPDPQAVLDGDNQNTAGENTAGFVPESWLKSAGMQMQVVALPAEIEQRLQLPVIAHSAFEPAGALRMLLACLAK